MLIAKAPLILHRGVNTWLDDQHSCCHEGSPSVLEYKAKKSSSDTATKRTRSPTCTGVMASFPCASAGLPWGLNQFIMARPIRFQPPGPLVGYTAVCAPAMPKLP